MTLVLCHGWWPRVIAAQNKVVRRLGDAKWHHLRSLYPIPIRPGAEVLDVFARLSDISSLVMSAKVQGAWVGGLSG